MLHQDADTAALLDMLGTAYALLDREGSWDDLLAGLRTHLALDACSLIRVDLKAARATVVAASGYDEALRQRLHGALASPDLALTEPLLRSALGSIWLDGDLDDRLHLRTTAFWRSWIEPQGFHGWGCAILDRTADATTYIEFLGRGDRIPFGQRTIRLLEALLPHLRRVVRLTLPTTPETTPRTVPDNITVPDRIEKAAANDGSIPRAPTAFELKLRHEFGLTRAESRLTAQLATGLSLKLAAERLHVSIHTARSHLAHVYDKTGTCRQTELLALVLHNRTATTDPVAMAS